MDAVPGEGLAGEVIAGAGSVREARGSTVLRFERRFRQPPEQVWAMLTVSARLTDWLAPGGIEPRVGGRARLHRTHQGGADVDGEVTACKAPRLLEFGWRTAAGDAGPVRWELHKLTGGTRLVFTHALAIDAGRDALAEALASWHVALELLQATLDGMPEPYRRERWEALRAHYAAGTGPAARAKGRRGA